MATSTYGSQLLSRLLESTQVSSRQIREASSEDREDGVVDGFNIPLDAQTRALSSRVKLPMARRIVALLSMAGIPGRYLAAEDAEGGIMQATDMLRKKASVRKAFLDFYSAMGQAKGYAISDGGDNIQEAGGESERKRGDYLTKMFTTVLIELGMPASFAGVSAPSVVSQSLLKTGQMIEEDGSLERALRILALRMGIKADDVRSDVQNEQVTEEDESDEPIEGEGYYVTKVNSNGREVEVEGPFKYEQEAYDRVNVLGGEKRGYSVSYKTDYEIRRAVGEALDVGQDEFMTLCVQVAEALGIPSDVLERRKQQVVKNLRLRKQQLRNRATILTSMRRLLTIVQSNEVKSGEKSED